MAISPYIAGLRAHVGDDLLLLPSVAAVIVGDDGRILLGRRADNGLWSLPAGSVDPGEQPATAIVREVYEEVGLDVAVERLAGVAMHPTRYPNGDRCEYLNVWFRCRPTGGTARVNDDESLEVAWFAPDRLPELKPFVHLRIETALADTVLPWFAPAGGTHPALTVSDVA